MYMIGKRLKKRHNILDDARQSLYNEVNFFLKAIENKGTQFIGGAEPNLADLAIYGCISSIDGNLSVGKFDKPQHHLINIFFNLYEIGTRSFDDLIRNTRLSPW